MARYRFALAAGGEFGASFTLRIARSSLDGARTISSDRLSTVTVQNGTALDTLDARTIEILDTYVGTDKLGRGVTIEKGRAGTRTVDYDAATDAERTLASATTIDSGGTRTR